MPRLTAQRAPLRKTAAPRRKPASRLRRMLITRGLPAAAVVAALGFGGWAVASGWAARSAAAIGDGILAATADAGFSLQQVLVSGRAHTDRTALLAALGIGRGEPILRFDPVAAHAAILELPWVEAAVVERRLPDTIFIRIEERRPMALWQNERRLRLIDQTGRVLAEQGLEEYADLPMIVGPDAPQHAAAMLSLLEAHPAIAGQVSAAVRVGGRRWDLQLKNGVTVRLPEEGADTALAQLAATAAESGLFERDVVAIDLRLSDRLVIQTSPLAAERRKLPEENT